MTVCSPMAVILNDILIQNGELLTSEIADDGQLKLIVILLVAFAFLAVFGLTFVVRAYRELRKQYNVIERQHDEIIEKNNELAFKNESLEELNMEKDNMISVVAHDLKAPLGNMLGLVELVKMDPVKLSQEQLDYLEMLKKVATDSTEMVDIMLNVHRIESEMHQLTLHQYNVAELVQKVVKLHEPAFKLKGGKIQFTPTGMEVILDTDKQYFQQIISSILQNAVDFSPKDATIKVELKELENDIAVSIKDNGPGISTEDQKRLFSGYNKLKEGANNNKSVGLGLGIAKRLLEKLHGRISLDSQEGKGALFTIAFPKKY